MLSGKNSFFYQVAVGEGHTNKAPRRERVITLELHNNGVDICQEILVLNVTIVPHQVLRAVLQCDPGVAVVAHHDLVRGHPIAPEKKG